MIKRKYARDFYTKEEQERIDKMLEEAIESGKDPNNWHSFEDVMARLDERIASYAKSNNFRASRN